MHVVDSCLPSDETNDAIYNRLQNYLNKEDFQRFRTLIEGKSHLPTLSGLFRNVCEKEHLEYRDEYAKGLLDQNIALKDYVKHGYAPIHIAAKYGHSDVVETLLQYGCVATKLTLDGETALHSAVRGAVDKKTVEAEERALKCIEKLTDFNKIDLDRCDVSGYTVVHLSSLKGLKSIVRYLLSKDVNIDVPSPTSGKTARNIIERMEDLAPLVQNYEVKEVSEAVESVLFRFLEDKHEKEFLNVLNSKNEFIDANASNGRHNLLQAAVTSNLTKATQALIKQGADIRSCINTNEESNVVALALQNGNDEILNSILDTGAVSLSEPHGPLNRTALHLAFIVKVQNIECVKSLLKNASKLRLNINAQDGRKYTALHYAGRRKNIEAVKLLLSHGANIFILNIQNVPAFNYVHQDVLRDYFDNQLQLTNHDICHPDFALEFNYNFLLPASKEAVATTIDDAIPMEDVPFTQHEAADDTRLLEMNPLYLLSESPRHQKLLSHPIITSFLYLKWQRLNWCFYINFFVNIMLTGLLSRYIYNVVTMKDASGSMNNNATSNEQCNTSTVLVDTNATTGTTLWWLITVCMCLIGTKEIYQMFLFGVQHFNHFINWIEFSSLIATSVLLFAPQGTIDVRTVAAIVVLLVYFQLILVIGRHPLLATYITMFLRVCKKFVQFLLWYSLLIGAFAFAFFILFHCQDQNHGCKCDNCTSTQENPSRQECKSGFFNDLSLTMFKTIIMSTGEYEAENITFDSISVTSHFVFILFLFFIAIVLLNLLTGLAVNDTQAIINEAEVLTCIARVQLYEAIESTLLGRLNNQRSPCARKVCQWLGRKILILTLIKPERKIKVFLNRGNRMRPDIREKHWQYLTEYCIHRNQCSWIRRLCNWAIGYNHIVSDALSIVMERDKISSEVADLNERISRVEQQIQDITKKLSDLR